MTLTQSEVDNFNGIVTTYLELGYPKSEAETIAYEKIEYRRYNG